MDMEDFAYVVGTEKSFDEAVVSVLKAMNSSLIGMKPMPCV